MHMIALAIAIVGEVIASTMLKLSDGFTKLVPVLLLLVGYGIAFVGLSISLEGIPLGMAYAIWSGVGTAATALVGVFVFKEILNLKKVIGIVLIIAGVVLLNVA